MAQKTELQKKPRSRWQSRLKWAIAVVAIPLVFFLAWQFPFTREGTVRLAGKLGWPVPLIRRSFDDEQSVRRAAFDALQEIGESAVPSLVLSLRDDDPSVRRQAAVALAMLGEKGNAAAPALMDALHDPEPEVRAKAIRALQIVAPGAKEAIPALVELLKDSDGNVRARATEALGIIGQEDQSLVPLIVGMLRDAVPEVRGEAVEALGRRGPKAKAVAAELKTMLENEPEYTVRKEIIKALMLIAPGSVDAEMIKLMGRRLNDRPMKER